MRFVAALVTLTLAAGGCAPHHYRATKFGGGALMGVGAFIGALALVSAYPAAADPDPNAIREVKTIAVVGGLTFVAGLVLFVVGDSGVSSHEASPEAARERAEADARRAELERAEAEQVTREAAQRAEEQRLERARVERERAEIRNREQAFDLLKVATAEARAGNCANTSKYDESIRQRDANVWEAWFRRDEAIKRCLNAAPPAPPVEPH